MGRRIFNKEFKLEAVKLVAERGVSAAQAARDLGIGQNVVSRWVREARADKQHAFPGRGVMKPEDAEIARLRRELVRTKAERDILKRVFRKSCGSFEGVNRPGSGMDTGFRACSGSAETANMFAWLPRRSDSGGCGTRTRSRVSDRDPRCAGSSAMRRRASSPLIGAQQDDLRLLWSNAVGLV